jgi:hypothetical protein
MKRSIVVPFLGIGFVLFVASVFSVLSPAVAEEHADSPGVQIHTSTVDGYGFGYSLYHFPERKTQHLMVSITGPDGAAVEQGKVGFLVTGPDGSKQKAMAMGMKGAYGADVDLGGKGVYTIKAKAVIENRKLFDTFTYEAK